MWLLLRASNFRVALRKPHIFVKDFAKPTGLNATVDSSSFARIAVRAGLYMINRLHARLRLTIRDDLPHMLSRWSSCV